MPTFEVYTTGGGYYLYDIFNFLAMFTSGSMWMDMLTVGLIVGVMFVAVRTVFTGNLQGTFGYVLMVATVGALGIGPKARVIVMDSTYPLEIYGAVDNVPYSVAFVASLTSETSYHLTRRMETLLSTPDNLVYQQHGMLFGASLMAQSARWRAVTPSVQANLVNFMENCMVDGTNIGLVDLDALTREGDLATFIAAEAPGALAWYNETTATVETCPQGWTGLAAEIETEILNILQTKAAARAPRGGNAAGYADVAALTGTLEDYQTMMGLAGYDATRYLRQSMLVLALDDAAGRLIANSGNSAAMQLYQTARAESQTRSSYQVIGANASKWVPLIKIAFETLYYGSFPLAMLLMMTPMALTVARGYFGGFVWLAAWEPLSAILHTTLLKASTGWYREHTTTFSGGSPSDVLNWANHFGVQSVEQDVGMVAGYLMMSVPFLAGAIMFGATKMMGLATSMLNVSQGAAIDTGREAATGSMSLGNTSMNNMNANTWNTSTMLDHGRNTRVLGDGGMVTTNRDGSQTYAAGSAQSNVGMTATVGQAVREEVSERASDAQRAVEAHSQDFSTSLTATASQLSDFGRTVSEGRSAGNDTSWTASEEERVQASEAWRQVEEFSERHGLSTDLGLRAMLTGQAGIGVGAGLNSLSGSLQAQGHLDATSAERFEAAVQDSNTTDYSSTVSRLISSADRAHAGSSSSESETASNSLRSNFDETRQSAARLSSSLERAQSLEQANAWLQSQDMAYNQTITDAVITELQERGYDEDEISALVNPKTTSGINRQQEVIGEFLPGIIEELGIGRDPEVFAPIEAPAGPNGDIRYAPVNPGAAQEVLPQPEFGTLEERNANVRTLTDGNFDKVHDGLAAADSRRGQTEAQIERGGQVVDQSVGEAFVDRAAGIVGLGPDGATPSPHPDPTRSASPSASDVIGRGLGNMSSVTPVGAALNAAAATGAMLTGGGGATPAQPQSIQPTTEALGQGQTEAQGDGRGADAAISLTGYERDALTRIVMGETAGRSADDQAWLAHTIRNRLESGDYGNDPAEVAFGLRPDIAVSGASSTSADYRQAASIVDQVFGANPGDPLMGRTDLPDWFGQDPAGHVGPLSGEDRDIVIRTVIGEAGREGEEGWAAVAHVIRNRVADSRFDNDASDVALDPGDFSAWNSGPGGNALVNRYKAGDPLYEAVGQVVDQVWGGQIRDMTGGATFYYSPAGMRALVDAEQQSNLEPRWLDRQNADRGTAPVQIGGHIFTGRVHN
ncbi:hypothetical protein EU803_14875 [Loktanella sp. IMCC34160]|uniref:conjugal transfer protein TraG N-terminal domain-containing protein n=1 Tax=Loktanella sp. IMCC34160 TaxID=2510646 RepID=UPI00101C997A|nr:conjugal transfer protein TraG N-terminal domain-containing protein [Loktanella sp. IMCC34160]RYG89904.1 hypothetical protein EU803_14875 [Loktanella sp. IMCC34160]